MTLLNQKRSPKWNCVALEPRWMLAGDAGAALEFIGAETASPSQPSVENEGGERIESVSARSLVFLDGSLDDLDTLVSGVDSNAEIILLDSDVSFFDQIGRHLRSHSNVASLHLVTHGSAGQLRLGTQVVDADSLRTNTQLIRQWRGSLADDADILLYGCNTGAGIAGEEFVDLMAALTGADVAASDDKTGAANSSADWDLEIRVGQIDTPVMLSHRAMGRYRHTLDVVVNASGQLGEEVFELLIDNSVVATFSASTEQQAFTYETDQSLTPEQVSVRFVNDFYAPSQGIDRNLIVDNVEISGATFESESPETYSTGTWRADDGPAAGYGRGQTLHTNGTFQYGGQQNGGPLQFDGVVWQGTKPGTNARVSSDSTRLILGPGGDEQVFSYVDLAGGGEFTLNVEAELVTDGSASRLRGFVGVDYFDSMGNEIGEAINIINPFWSSSATEVSGVAPANTAFATIWLSHINSSSSESSELVVRNVDFQKTETPSDSVAPTATLQTDVVTVQPNNPFPSSPSFVVLFGDEIEPGVPNQTAPSVITQPVTVTSPDGTTTTPPVFTGGPGPASGQVFNVIGVPEGANGFVEGEYVVAVKPNTVFDTAGNPIPAGVIGSFRVEIDEGPANPDDTTPPTVELLTEIYESSRDQFSILARDSQSKIRFNQQGDISVIGPDGNPVDVVGFAGGDGQEPNTLFEVYRITSPNPLEGTHQVFVDAGYVIDESGNVNEPGLIGTFEYVLA